MADSLSSTEARKVEELLAYMDAWQSAIVAYRRWYAAQWESRLARFKRMLDQAEDEIAMLAVNMLPLAKDGTIDMRRMSSRVKVRRFLKKKDRIIARLISKARRLMGARIVFDADLGLFRGTMLPQLRESAQGKLKEVMRDLQRELNAIEKGAVNA